MKLLIVGNHTCANRGDSAILRGLIRELQKQHLNVDIDVYSRFPVSSTYLLGKEVLSDKLTIYHQTPAASFFDRLWKKVSPRFLAYYLVEKLDKDEPRWIPAHIAQQVKELQQYDAIIQVGGSFFVDLYGPAQFEHAICALLAKKPLYLLGHSVGPFVSKRYAKLASKVFSRVNCLALREILSCDYMAQADINRSKVINGSDTAWGVANDVVTLPEHLTVLFKDKPVIAISLRNLSPFDKRLGVTQSDYEEKFVELINSLNDLGYFVVLCSTCTGVDGYQRDDRMIALKVQSLITDKDSCYVIMDELNDIELGSLLSLCVLTIGTRLHSAIISMNFGTLAIAINYEHKSKGIMAQLGMPELSKDISKLFDGTLLIDIKNILLELPQLTEIMHIQVSNERKKVSEMVSKMLEEIHF